jgi:hypothetical protein
MKYITILIAFLIFGELKSNAQRGPILPYGSHTKEEIKKLSLGDSKKSQEYRDNLLYWLNVCLKDSLVLNGNNLDWIFNHIGSEEVNLKEGQYQNSGITPKDKIEFFSGHDYEGYAGVFRCGSYMIVLYKENCANLLRVSQKLKQINPVGKVPEKKDTIPPPPVKKRLPDLVEKEKKPIRDTIVYIVKETKTIIHDGQDWSTPVRGYSNSYYRPLPQISFWMTGNNRQQNYQLDPRYDPPGNGGTLDPRYDPLGNGGIINPRYDPSGH